MSKLLYRALIAAALITTSLTGCASITTPESPAPTAKGENMSTELTWQEAKATTQKKQLEIAALIPANIVVNIEQAPKGVLLSCNNTGRNWNGATTITVAAGTEIEPIVKAIQNHYENSEFTIKTRLDIAQKYEVQLIAPDNVESHLIAEDIDPDKIRIDSGSACFTVPEGMYPGGEF